MIRRKKIVKRPFYPIAVLHKKWLLFISMWRLRGKVQFNSIVKYPENLHMSKGTFSNDRCWFNARFCIYIGKNTLMGPNIMIHTVDHVVKNLKIEQNTQKKNRVEGKRVVIGDDVWIGANTIILKGSVIPDKCVIGAGTLITEKNSKRLRPGDIVVNDAKLKKLGNRKHY